jgi:peptidoglycan/LPS O-acetylase OafA/YrhL
MQNPTGRRYITGFDGLRALAVIGVMTFHLWPQTIRGGWLGVPLFFVLSGYLITDLLIQEFDRTRRVDFVGFYRRRLQRLYPALVVMLFATATMIGLFARDLLYNLRVILATNLTYIYNLWATKHADSYFDAWGGASPFTHLWSLSIEGQFYLFWPIIVLLLLRFFNQRRKIAGGLMVVAFVSAALMAFYYDPANINRTYYGTDTRMFAILIGTALAFVWPSNHLPTRLNRDNRMMLNVVGFGALLVTAVAFLFLDGQTPVTYYGFMFLITLIIGILIAVTAHPASIFSKLLDNPVLNYLGTRSYSIYLYQLPVFIFVERINHNASWPMQVMKIIIVLALSELSYRFVENSFRRVRKVNFSLTAVSRISHSRGLKVVAGIAAVFLLGTANAVFAKEAGESKPKSELQKRLEQNQSKIKDANKKAAEAQSNSQPASSQQAVAASSSAAPELMADNAIAANYGLSDAAYAKVTAMSLTAVGDSVMLDIAPDLQEVMPKAVVDGQVGRQTKTVPGILQTYANKNTLANTVLITIGTNGSISAKEIDDIMAIVGKNRTVYWVIPYADRVWIGGNVYELNQALQRYSNLKLIDWKSNVEPNKSTWLGPDGVHPNKVGALEYTKIVVKDLAK